MPKLVFHTWQQHILAAQAVILNTGLSKRSISLLSMPLNHIGGFAIAVRAECSDGRWVLPHKAWVPTWALEQGVTHLSLVSTQLWRWMQDPIQVRALRKLKAILLGGSAISRKLIKKAYEAELPIITTYGSTETCSQVTATKLGDSLEKLYTSGRCLVDREIRVDASGEILVRGAMIGYCHPGLDPGSSHNNCVALNIDWIPGQARDDKEWYATGDLGRIDSDGYLHVLGRRDNRMISGGKNIYPEEIERALLEHPDIERALVVAKADPEFGQKPAAFVKLSHANELKPIELQAFLRDRLEGFKVPKYWHSWPPKTPKLV
ncbi:MAG: AMP-binding protein [Deltaproteobacteria bacterium]|nr:AMP-binding protein [Deltaproteobacteria bacterium]